VLIKTNSEGRLFKSTKVGVCLKCAFYYVFMSDGVQLNPIKLIDGENKAEIVGTPIKPTFFNTNDNFELVD
jgi:hypothetical protein